jgi:multiple sugar transport system substrate-binding protein
MLAPSYGTNVDDGFWHAVTADFEAANPDIKVTVEVVQGARAEFNVDASNRLTTRPPDLYLGTSYDEFPYNTAGHFYPADEIAPPGNDLLPCFTSQANPAEPGGYPGFGVPFTGAALELYYNKRLFTQAHITAPPTTWNDVAADAAKIKALGKHGYGLAWTDPDSTAATMQLWMAGNGGGFMDAAKTKWTVNQPANVDTIQWIDDNLINPSRTELGSFLTLEQEFADGNLGMLVADPGLIAKAESSAVGTAFGIAPIPGRLRPLASSLGAADDVLATTAHPDHKAAIGKFVAFLLSPKYQRQFADLAGRLPVTRSGAAAEGPDPLLKPFLDAMPTVGWLPYRVPGWESVQSALQGIGPNNPDSHPKAYLDGVQSFVVGQP